MHPTHLSPPSVLNLISQAGFVAQLVLLILLAASIFCWAIIISKWKSLKIANEQNTHFLETFWAGKNLDEIVLKSDKFPHSPIAQVFNYAVKELKKLSINEASSRVEEKIENIQRALLRASNSEISHLERNVGFLATTASAAPFVGLFGTVWGIMNSFQSIGVTGNAHLAVVAPGISEALITTATGIAAAIPAIIAYNFFLNQIKKIALDIDCFTQDFINIIHRSLTQGRKGL